MTGMVFTVYLPLIWEGIMCLKYEFDATENLVVITVLGNCDMPVLVNTLKAITSDSLFNRQTKILIDKSQVTNFPTVDEAQSLVEILGSTFQGHQIVTVASDPCLFGLNRMISTRSAMKGCRSRVVKTLSEAVSWLA